MIKIQIRLNGYPVEGLIEPRTSLADFIRDGQRLTGTHLGCEHGVCGACTLLVDGRPMRACLMLAASADGCHIRTVEGYKGDETMAVIHRCFTECHALQCGFCTPGMLATAYDIVTRLPGADRARIRAELSGNLCRCTGYLGIIAAIEQALDRVHGKERGARPS
ncbi:MAG TPA: (2Fe-2S)-binding protein [Alphaproteobacteria bacterium]